jgi:hypothetical protein
MQLLDSAQELDFFELSQGKSEEMQPAQAADAPSIGSSVTLSDSSPPCPAKAPSATHHIRNLRRGRVVLSSDDEAAIVPSDDRLPDRSLMMPVDDNGCSSVKPLDLLIPNASTTSRPQEVFGDMTTRELRRMSVANGEVVEKYCNYRHIS